MHQTLKIALIALTAVLVAVSAVAGSTAVWLKSRIDKPEYCASCHVIAPYYESWKSSAFTAHTHAKAGLACQDCHTRTVRDGLREIVSTVTHRYDLPLEARKISRETCFRCHGSDEILASRTEHLTGPDGFALGRNPHASHWGPLECNICHKMHQPSVDFCSKCHGFPASGPAWTSPLPRSLRTNVAVD